MFKLSSLADIFDKILYKDKLDVYRLEVVENDGLTYQNKQAPVPIYVGQPCKISNNFKDLPEEDSFMINPTNQHISVFCSPSLDIKKGDKLVLHRLNDSNEETELLVGVAGKPNKEINHQEISLIDRNFA